MEGAVSYVAFHPPLPPTPQYNRRWQSRHEEEQVAKPTGRPVYRGRRHMFPVVMVGSGGSSQYRGRCILSNYDARDHTREGRKQVTTTASATISPFSAHMRAALPAALFEEDVTTFLQPTS
jgi:hypothetical protein